jgi:hypothetical protein
MRFSRAFAVSVKFQSIIASYYRECKLNLCGFRGRAVGDYWLWLTDMTLDKALRFVPVSGARASQRNSQIIAERLFYLPLPLFPLRKSPFAEERDDSDYRHQPQGERTGHQSHHVRADSDSSYPLFA